MRAAGAARARPTTPPNATKPLLPRRPRSSRRPRELQYELLFVRRIRRLPGQRDTTAGQRDAHAAQLGPRFEQGLARGFGEPRVGPGGPRGGWIVRGANATVLEQARIPGMLGSAALVQHLLGAQLSRRR